MRKTVAGLIVGLGAAAIVLGSNLLFNALADRIGFHPLETVELKTYDWRLIGTAQPATARKDLALVEIDEYSLRNLEQNAGRWPWPRAVHSMLLDYLARAPARIVAYDVNFAEADTRTGFAFGGSTWSGAESDRALVDSVRKSGNVLLPADATYEGQTVDKPPSLPDVGFHLQAPLVAERKVIFPPFGALADAAAGLGHNLFVLDADGPLRHTVPFVRVGETAWPSLGLSAAFRAANVDPATVRVVDDVLQVGERRMPLLVRRVKSQDGPRAFYWSLVNFRGPALLADLKSRPYPRYAFFDLLYAEEQLLAGQQPKVDPAEFKDKIVFVGVTASGLFDTFETPFSRGRMPGVQVQAAIADDFLSNRFIGPVGDGVRLATVAVFAIAIGLITTAIPAWWATAMTAVFLGLLAWTGTRLFASGHWMNLTQPALASALALFGGVVYQYLVEGREKRKVTRLFGKYVSKDVLDQLVAHPELAQLGGQRRDMTVLFSDIRGFTTLTERGKPEDTVGMLNEYFTRMVDVVFRHQGTVDKFVGDMVMALFGAPLDDPQHADHAVDAAIEMIAELDRLNAEWRNAGRPSDLDIGIGINTGPMIAGNIGSSALMSYTVIGDAVNLASRLESLNKQYGTRILISDATRQRLTGRYPVRALGEVVVKGKTEAVGVFEVVAKEAGT